MTVHDFLRADPVWKGFVSQRSKQEVTEVASLCKNDGKQGGVVKNTLSLLLNLSIYGHRRRKVKNIGGGGQGLEYWGGQAGTKFPVGT